MSITVKSGASSDTATVDATSKAIRVTGYDTNGRVTEVDSKATYSAATATFTPPATPSDFFIINGSASKTVRIISLKHGATQTTAGINTFYLIRRTSANTGGTAVTTTIVKHDTNDGAATAVAQHYTANPTTGSSSGQIRTAKILTPAATSVAGPLCMTEMLPCDADGMYRPIVLRGTAEGLALNFNGAALPSGMASFSVECTWIEE